MRFVYGTFLLKYVSGVGFFGVENRSGEGALMPMCMQSIVPMVLGKEKKAIQS